MRNEQEHENMNRSLWFNFTTILALACWSLSVCNTPLRGDDAPAAASHEADPKAAADHKPAEAAHDSKTEDGTHDAGHGDGHGDEGHGAGEKKGPMEWKTDLALWTLVTFFAFLIVLKTLAWKPLMSALETREQGILGNVENANKARIDAESTLADYKAKLQKAEDEVRQLLADARKAAENARSEMLATTQKEVTSMKDRAVAEIDQVRVQALEELFAHMAGTVTKATEQVLRRSLTSADQDRLVNEAVSQFAKR